MHHERLLRSLPRPPSRCWFSAGISVSRRLRLHTWERTSSWPPALRCSCFGKESCRMHQRASWFDAYSGSAFARTPASPPRHSNERLDQLRNLHCSGAGKPWPVRRAATMTSLTTLVGASVGLVAFPEVAALQPEQRIDLIRARLRLAIGAAALMTLPLCVFAPYLIRFLFGPQFAGATTAARILLVAAVALVATSFAAALWHARAIPGWHCRHGWACCDHRVADRVDSNLRDRWGRDCFTCRIRHHAFADGAKGRSRTQRAGAREPFQLDDGITNAGDRGLM